MVNWEKKSQFEEQGLFFKTEKVSQQNIHFRSKVNKKSITLQDIQFPKQSLQ